jgi:hypothetical protein
MVHSAGLSVNSAGLSAKSAGIRRLEISLFIFSIKWISADFYRILPNSVGFFQKPTESKGADFLVSTDF